MAEEYCWAITGFGPVMLRPVRFRCVGDWVAPGLPCKYIHVCLYAFELQLEQYLTGHEYYLSRGSVYVSYYAVYFPLLPL